MFSFTKSLFINILVLGLCANCNNRPEKFSDVKEGQSQQGNAQGSRYSNDYKLLLTAKEHFFNGESESVSGLATMRLKCTQSGGKFSCEEDEDDMVMSGPINSDGSFRLVLVEQDALESVFGDSTPINSDGYNLEQVAMAIILNGKFTQAEKAEGTFRLDAKSVQHGLRVREFFQGSFVMVPDTGDELEEGDEEE